jgi:enterochelin esterase-like enzyme
MLSHSLCRFVFSITLTVVAAGCLMSDAIAQSLVSPEVHSDGRVTLRLRAEKAMEIEVSLDGKKIAMVKSDKGIWEGTSEPLPPQIYDYTFKVDGTTMIDPSNRLVKKWLTLASMVEIPGTPPRLTEFTDVPHGVVQRLIYPSASVGHSRPVVVYTPPGYEATSDTHYPLVLLLHGYGDDETAWTDVGRAHLIADNLIAAGKIEPVIIVMPYGHPVPIAFGERPDDYFGRNNDLYEQDITKDLLPFVEQKFHVRNDVAGRSIVGLSMGGGHALDTGLKNIDRFSSIGAFSAATPQLETDVLLKQYPSLSGSEPAANSLKHLWIPIGDKDFLLERNEKFVEQLKTAGVKHDYLKTEGGHEWKLWRDYLPQFLEKVAGK